MKVTEKVIIEINNRNLHFFKRLESKYDIKIGLIEICVEDLAKGSHCLIDVECDSCGVINNIEWRSYLKFTKNESEIYCCKKCNNIKVRKTNLERYGVVCNSQLDSNKKMVKEKWSNKTEEEKNLIVNNKKETCLEKYGVDSYTKTDEFKEKSIKTFLERYGVTNPSYLEDVKKKRVNTKLEKFGYINNSQTEEWKYSIKNSWKNKSNKEKDSIKQLRMDTCNSKYGVDHYSMTDEYKEKFKKTLMINYGVDHPMRSEIIFNKQQKSGLKTKEYENSNLSYQGTYELDFLEKYYNRLNIEKIDPIRYFLYEKTHYYHPDFYLPEYNLIIEIKSNYTYNYNIDRNLAKKEYSIKSGYNFIFIIDKDYTDFEKIING